VIGATSWPSRRETRIAVVALASASALGSFDRAIVTVAGQQLRRDFGMTDTQFGLLSGLAFAVPLALVGLLAGRLADRTSRKRLLLGGVALWSAMTALCGGTRSLGALFLARIGVGAGEATLAPAAMSMLADDFPPERRAGPVSAYFVGGHLGQGLAFALGGAMLGWLDARGHWQLVFPIAGLLGLMVVALLALVREPERRERLRTDASEQPLRVADVAAYVGRRAAAFAVVFVAPPLLAIGFSALVVFLPMLLQRAHGWPIERAGVAIAAVGLPVAISGSLLAGALGRRVAPTGGHARVLAWAIALAAPCCTAIPLMPSGGLALAALGIGLLFYSIGLALPPMAIQAIAPNQMRGQLVGTLHLLTGLLGFGLGPVVAGSISDRIGSLPVALAVLLGATFPLAAVVAFSCIAAYERVERDAADWRAS
jgi:MFS family permease